MYFQTWQSINHKKYDQHNDGVKDDRGAVGLTECLATHVQRTRDGTRVSLLSLEDESIAHCAGGHEWRKYSWKM